MPLTNKERLRYLRLKAKQGGAITPPSVVEQEEEERVVTGITGRPISRGPKSKFERKAEILGSGFAEGATLGAINLIPGAREEQQKAKEEEPLLFGAGEVGSFFIPGTGQAKAFKGGTKIAKKIIPAAAKGVSEGLGKKVLRKGIEGGVGGAISEGVKGTVGEGDINIVKGAKEAGKGLATGAVVSGTLAGIGPVLKTQAVKFAQSAMKPLKGARKGGFKQENVFKHDVGGSFQQTVKKSKTKIDGADKKLKNIIDNWQSANPKKKIFADDLFDDVLNDIDKGKIPGVVPGDFQKATNVLNAIITDQKKTGKLGELIDLQTLRKLKTEVGKKAYIAGREGEIGEKEAIKEVYRRLSERMNSIIPEAIEQNQIMADLLPVKEVAESAIERFGNRNKIFSLKNLFILGGGIGIAGTTGSTEALIPAVALAAGTSALGSGSGAQLVHKAGQAAGSQALQRGITGTVGKIEEELGKSKITFPGKL